VVYNNRYGQARGTIDFSAAYADKASAQLRQQRLKEGLGLNSSPDAILAWRDSLTGLEYLRRSSDLSARGLTLDLCAYQCHVFLDWRELYATAEQPWDRLSDQLNGRGVANLEDALVNLELQPVHDALRAQLDSGMVRLFADLAEHPRTLAVGINKKIEVERSEFFEQAWMRCERFLRLAQKAYLARSGRANQFDAAAQPANPGLLGPAFRERLRAAMRIPAVEALFRAPWTVAARRMLPSPSPQLTATAMWGPVLGWCALELLAESIDVENPESVALDLFDCLRLREPFAQAFTALGFEGEEGWRVAARIKVVLLTGAGVGKPEEAPPEAEPGAAPEESTVAPEALVAPPEARAAPTEASAPAAETPVPEVEPARPKPAPGESTPGEPATAETTAAEQPAAVDERVALSPALWPALWFDPDVRWLSGVHQAEGHAYLVRERYEELLWWLLMPSLLRLAGEAAPSRTAVEEMSRTVEEALATAEAAGYRVDLLLGPATAEAAGAGPGSEAESEAAEEQPLPTEDRVPPKPEINSPAEPADEPAGPVEPAQTPLAQA
jgi:hypothetical protein